MANIITAGNSTNGGTAITTDTSGTLNIVTGSGSGANAITIDASQAVTIPNTLAVTGAQTIGGNLTVTGTLTASGGVSGSITNGTAVSASGTSVTFTGIPSTVKSITVMFVGVSTNGTSLPIVQLGTSSGVVTSGYLGSAGLYPTEGGAIVSNGIAFEGQGNASGVRYGKMTIDSFGSNVWVGSAIMGYTHAAVVAQGAGAITLSGTLDRIRITTVNGTDTFDAGTINILYE